MEEPPLSPSNGFEEKINTKTVDMSICSAHLLKKETQEINDFLDVTLVYQNPTSFTHVFLNIGEYVLRY